MLVGPPFASALDAAGATAIVMEWKVGARLALDVRRVSRPDAQV